MLNYQRVGCSNHSVWFQYEKKDLFSLLSLHLTKHKTNLGEPRLSPAWPWPSKCSPSTGALAPKVTIKPTFTDEKISKVSKVAIQVGLIIIVGTSIISSESKVITKLLLIKSISCYCYYYAKFFKVPEAQFWPLWPLWKLALLWISSPPKST